VLDTRGGYKDYFRGHLPTAHHINFDTLRGTNDAVPVQYLPDDLTKALLIRAGADKDRLHLVYATGAALPNDEILSTSMVVYVLEKFGVQNIRVVDGGLAGWVKAGLDPAKDYFGNPAGKLPEKGNASIGVDVKTVQAHVGKPSNLLVDARPLNEYQGDDDVWLRKGHIPGAISFHWARLMESDNTHQFKSTRHDESGAGSRWHHARQKHHLLLRHLARRQPDLFHTEACPQLPKRPPLRRLVERIRLARRQSSPG
jgi:thiosulfate/3-mercaptopyruvate sulfurtransferase